MLTTRRYEYLSVHKVALHPSLTNHRPLDAVKVKHLENDILANGLLEPLVVWERTAGEFFLVGGFHRMEAIKAIRAKNPGYFDRVDVRVVGGDPDEMRALNLKLNADRLDTKITDYFATVIYLNNANWSKERIAEFLDKSVPWIEEIIRYAPSVSADLHKKLEAGELSWNKAKLVIRQMLAAPAGAEKAALKKALDHVDLRPARPLTFRSAIARVSKVMKTQPRHVVRMSYEDIYSLILVLQGKTFSDAHVARVQAVLPELLEEGRQREE